MPDPIDTTDRGDGRKERADRLQAATLRSMLHLARYDRADTVAWVSAGGEPLAPENLLDWLADDRAPDDDLRPQLEQICQSGATEGAAMEPGAPGPVTQCIALPVALDGGWVERTLWLGKTGGNPLDEASERERLRMLAGLGQFTAKLDADDTDLPRGSQVDWIARVEQLCARLSEIFCKPGRPIHQRLTAFLIVARDVLDMDYAYITHSAPDGPRIRHISDGKLARVAQEAGAALNELVQSHSGPLLLFDVARSDHAGNRDLTGRVPGAFAGVQIAFDGLRLGSLEFGRDAPFSTEFDAPHALALNALALLLAPFLYLMD